MLNNIPHEMKIYRQWLVWRLELRKDQKPTKVPYQPWPNGHKASVTNSDDWRKLAQQTGLHFAWIRSIAKGDTVRPSADKAEALIKAISGEIVCFKVK